MILISAIIIIQQTKGETHIIKVHLHIILTCKYSKKLKAKILKTRQWYAKIEPNFITILLSTKHKDVQIISNVRMVFIVHTYTIKIN